MDPGACALCCIEFHVKNRIGSFCQVISFRRNVFGDSLISSYL